MTCPVCGRRTGRRACPALGQEICTICCATKRQTEIRCPSDCRYLVATREHPAAAVVRQREDDLAVLIGVTRDYSERQTGLFVLVNRAILDVPADPLQPLIDEDVVEASAATAATPETAVK